MAICLFAASQGYGQEAVSLAAYVPRLYEAQRAEVLEGRSLIRDAGIDRQFRFLGKSPEAEGLRREALAAPKGLLLEGLFLIPSAKVSDDFLLRMVNRLAQVETLSGVTYFSHTRKKVTVLFDQVFRVEAAGSKSPLAGKSYAAMPLSDTSVIHIRDVNFGSTWYETKIGAASRGFSFSLSNEKPLGISLFQAFDARGFELRFLAEVVTEGILFSGLFMGEPSPLASSFVDIYSAVEKRMRAIQGWILASVGP